MRLSSKREEGSLEALEPTARTMSLEIFGGYFQGWLLVCVSLID
jgi:hypothetical protein